MTEGNVDCRWPTLDANNTLYFVTNAVGVNSGKMDIYKDRLNLE